MNAIDRYVEQLVADAPPLTETQKARVLALIGPAIRAYRQSQRPAQREMPRAA